MDWLARLDVRPWLTARPSPCCSRRRSPIPGRVRTNNEDLPVLDAERGVFGVIDGVGGHAAGELAAAIARDVILQRLARPLGTPAERVREAIAIANNEIFRRAASEPALAGMTCVVTLAVVADGRVTVGHVGDSRLYKLRPSGLRKLTHDHSPVGEREDAHEIGEIEAMHHPRRHEVFRDVGSALRDKDEPDYVEVIDDTFEDDAAILVCSDGLTDMIPSTTIERVVRLHAGDAAAVTTALVAAANEAGGRDNVTVVYAEAPGFAAAFKAGTAAVPVMRRRQRLMQRAWSRRAGRWARACWLAAPRGSPSAPSSACSARLLLAWRLSTEVPVGGRTIVAAPAGIGDGRHAGRGSAGGTRRRRHPPRARHVRRVDRRPRGRVHPGARARQCGVRPAGERDRRVGRPHRAEETAAPSPAFGSPRPRRRRCRWASESAARDDRSSCCRSTGPSPQASTSSRTPRPRCRAVTSPSPVRPSCWPRAASSMRPATSSCACVGSCAGSSRLPSRQRACRTPPVIRHAPRDGARVVLNRNVFAGFGPTPIEGLADAEREPVRTANVIVSSDPSTR